MDWKKAHFIGIGGVGMSAVATLLKDAGVKVSGSDEGVYEPVLGVLTQSGLVYHPTYSAGNIPADADVIVVGKNAKLTKENPEVAAARASGKKMLSFPEVLAELAVGKEVIVVAGSYGKSTCTALLAHCLERAGKDPSYFIGAPPLSPARAARLGTGPLFVMEGDEYPASNSDPRAKFLLMHPRHALITPLAHDHFNIFPTPADYLKPFYELARLAETLVVCRDGALSKEFISSVPCATYGLDDAKHIAWGETTTFELDGMRVETTLLGAHNIQNIVGAWTLAKTLGLLTLHEFAAGVRTFRGIRRRLDKKSDRTSIPVYEGFGSSYEKAKSAIAAMRLHYPEKRLVVVFEPFSINWRRREALAQYTDAFAGAVRVVIVDPKHGGDISARDMATQVARGGIVADTCAGADDCLATLDLQKDDAVLLLSSGPLYGLPDLLPRYAEQKFPA